MHKNVQSLEREIRNWIKTWNEAPKPFVRTKTADEILERQDVVGEGGGDAEQDGGGAAQERTVVATLRPWCEKFPGVPVVETVAEGRVTSELVRASTGASLVVVGRRTRDGRLGSHIGPVTHAVLHHVCCPVAVVPHD